MKITRNSLLTSILLLGVSLTGQSQTINTVAGNGTAGYIGIGTPATAAELNAPAGVAVDGSGNMYIADALNHVVRKVSSTGVITTIAGNNTPGFSGDGFAATMAQLNTPVAVALDATGNIYISENKNNIIRKVTVSTGIISTYAGSPGGPGGFSGDNGPATVAQLWGPMGIAIDGGGNLFIADDSNNRVRTVIVGGTIYTYAGSGIPGYAGAGYGGDTHPATAAKLNCPSAVAFDGSNVLYISDASNARIRAVDPVTHNITTFAGNGTPGFAGDGMSAGSAELKNPGGMSINAAGDVYFADVSNNRVRMISGTSNVISTICGAGATLGDGGPASAAQLVLPSDVKLDATGNIYVADAGHNRVRKITAGPGITIMGTFTVCIGKTVTLTDATTGGTWTSGTSSVATIGTSGVVTGVSAGTSIITYNSGTNAAYQTVTVTNCKAGVANTTSDDNGLKIYPNPNDGSFSILLTASPDEQAAVTLTNIMGAKVKEYNISTNKPTDLQMDVAPGVYFLMATTPHGRWSEKISIVR